MQAMTPMGSDGVKHEHDSMSKHVMSHEIMPEVAEQFTGFQDVLKLFETLTRLNKINAARAA
jgi:hypothetical protein